ncbi:hypothetical protein ACVNP0_13380 [Staphylococcus aureus]
MEVTNENTDEKVLKDNEHSPLLFAKRRKDKEEEVLKQQLILNLKMRTFLIIG